MKTIQEHYLALKEGKTSKNYFQKLARTLFPNLVSNQNSFNDTVKILKNRGIITEAAKAVEKKPSKDVMDVQAKQFNYQDKNNIDTVYGAEFLKGFYAEIKDPANSDKTPDQIKEIVRKNLTKSATHYTENSAFGIKGIGYGKAEQPKEVTGKYKSSGYGDLKESKVPTMTELLLEGKKKTNSVEEKLAEIEESGAIVTLETQIEAVEEMIESKSQRLEMISEDDNLSELVDKKKVKELQKEIKILEKRKAKMQKMYEKLTGKAKKQIVDETSTDRD